jgi:hypothetical protein
MVIDANGNVGIGTTAPAATLDVTGTGRFTGDASFNSRVIVGSDVSLGGRIFIPANNLYVGGSVFTGGGGGSSNIFTTDVSVNGNLYCSKILKPTSISEVFTTNTGTISPYTLDFSTGGTFYITTPPSSNFNVNITNVPSDINRTYVITLVIAATANKTFSNSVQINSAAAIIPYYAGGIPTITSASIITQSISIQRITSGDVAANVNVLSSVTGWY